MSTSEIFVFSPAQILPPLRILTLIYPEATESAWHSRRQLGLETSAHTLSTRLAGGSEIGRLEAELVQVDPWWCDLSYPGSVDVV